MLRYRDTTDLIRRRTNNCMGPDGVDTVYLKFNEDRTHGYITFILKDDKSPTDVTKLAVRYQHLLDDYQDRYTLKVLPATNTFQKDIDTISIWHCREGYSF